MTKLDSILKTRDIILPTKVHRVKAMVFLVGMHGYESWNIKKAECQRIDAFELWCWRRLESPVDCRLQTSLSMEFSRQEYLSELPCPPTGDLPNPRIKPGSPALQADSLPLRQQGKTNTV